MALTKISGSVIKDSVSLSGNVSVGGTLTYQDVTNVDALGIGTFRTGIDITGGNLTIPDKIIHSGDTNTAIRFPAADTIQFETSGHDRICIKSDGKIGMGTDTPAVAIHHFSDGLNGNSLRLENREGYSLLTNDGGALHIDAGFHIIRNQAGSTEFLRITSNGDMGLGTNSPDRKLDVSGTGNVYGKFQSTDTTGAGIEVKDISERWLIQADGGNVDGLAFYDLGRTSYRFIMGNAGQFGVGAAGGRYGTTGQVLTSGGAAGAVSWTTITGTTINNNGDNKLITGTGTANTINAEADLTFDGTNLKLTDHKNMYFGTGNDLRIWHDANNSYSQISSGQMNFYIDGLTTYMRSGNGSSGVENAIVMNNNASVDLYYSGTKKFSTDSTGFYSTNYGDYIAVSSNGSAASGRFGYESNYKMYLQNTRGTGTKVIFDNDGKIRSQISDGSSIVDRFEVNVNGATVTGTCSATAFSGSSGTLTGVAFAAVRTAGNSNNTPFVFNSEEFDIGSDYNASNGIFTAPDIGYYQITVQMTSTSYSGNRHFYLDSSTNGGSSWTERANALTGTPGGANESINMFIGGIFKTTVTNQQFRVRTGYEFRGTSTYARFSAFKI